LRSAGSRDPRGIESALGRLRCQRFRNGAPHLSRGRGAGLPAVRRANPRSKQHTGPARWSAKQKRFTVQRIIGSGDLWVTELILTYDGKPSYTVSIMEFSGDKIAHETQYFADPFVAPAFRAQWVERIDT